MRKSLSLAVVLPSFFIFAKQNSSLSLLKSSWFGYETDHIYYLSSSDYDAFHSLQIASYSTFLNIVQNSSVRYPFKKENSYSITSIERERISIAVFNQNNEAFFAIAYEFNKGVLKRAVQKCFGWHFEATYRFHKDAIVEVISFYSPQGRLLEKISFDISSPNELKRIVERQKFPEYESNCKKYNEQIEQFGNKSGYKYGVSFAAQKQC